MIYTALHIGYRMMPFVEIEFRLNPALRLNGGTAPHAIQRA